MPGSLGPATWHCAIFITSLHVFNFVLVVGFGWLLVGFVCVFLGGRKKLGFFICSFVQNVLLDCNIYKHISVSHGSHIWFRVGISSPPFFFSSLEKSSIFPLSFNNFALLELYIDAKKCYFVSFILHCFAQFFLYFLMALSLKKVFSTENCNYFNIT